VFFPECFLRVLVTIDLRDLPVAARFPLPALFCFLAAAPLAGLPFASKTVQMKSAIIHAPFAGGSLLSRRISGRARGQFDARRRLPPRVPVLADDGRVNAAADVEFRGQPREARREQADQIGKNPIADGLWERTDVPIRPDVKLERLELDAKRGRHVFEIERREIGLSRLRTETRELRVAHANRVIAIPGG